MKWYYISTNGGVDPHDGTKARMDVDRLAVGAGMEAVRFAGMQSAQGRLKDQLRLLWNTVHNWVHLLRTVSKDSAVLVQYPIFPIKTVYIAYGMLCLIQRIRHVRFIALVHDLNSARRLYGKTALFSDLRFLPCFDVVVCHNDHMKAKLENNGIEADKLIALGLFDYLTDALPQAHSYSPSVVIAGNLDRQKCGYLYQLADQPKLGYDLHLYGPNFSGCANKHEVHYHGQYSAEELPAQLEGSFGLVWDGDRTDTCSGDFGEYLRLNDPHKASLYLAAGIPVIIWKEAALAEWVMEHGVGITIANLSNLPDAFARLNAQRYLFFQKNTLVYSKQLRSGHNFLQAIHQSEKLF